MAYSDRRYFFFVGKTHTGSQYLFGSVFYLLYLSSFLKFRKYNCEFSLRMMERLLKVRASTYGPGGAPL